MKLYINLLFLILFPIISFGQKIDYKKTFAQASSEAKYLKKNILVIVNIDSSEIKNQKILFEDIAVINEINKTYVVYKTNFQDAELNYIYKYYALCNCPTFLFLNPNKNVFYKSVEFEATKDRFLKIITEANLTSNEKDATELHRKFNSDTTNVTILKELIAVRKKSGITNNAYFIEKYVKFLNPIDLKDYQTVLFILEAGPRLGGPAYAKAYTHKNIIDSIFKTETQAMLRSIGARMIANTIDIGIKTKCLADAVNVANYYKNQWKDDQYNGQKIYNEKMLFYYNAIKDTANYFQTAIKHYNKYYMTVTVDSVNRLKQEEKEGKVKLGWRANSYQENLNKASWDFYNSTTKNNTYLSEAIKWSKRSIEIEPKANFYQTLSHLYYISGNFNKAEKMQLLAINQAKKNEISTVNFENNLLKIKNRTL